MPFRIITIGIIVSFYPNSDYCEVEFWDTVGDPVDVVTYVRN